MNTRKKILAIDAECFTKGLIKEMAASIAETQEAKLGEQNEQLLVENAMLLEKVKIYEQLLHRIQLNAAVTMNEKVVHQLIGNICNWSYAHRVGNGELSEEEQNQYIKRAFDKLLEIKRDI